jgi:hypothetical protein
MDLIGSEIEDDQGNVQMCIVRWKSGVAEQWPDVVEMMLGVLGGSG